MTRPERAFAGLLFAACSEALVCGACRGDDDDPAIADAAADAPSAEPDAGAPHPEPPAPPALEPCPAGWRLVDGDPQGAQAAVATCDPAPEGGPPDCGDGEAWFAGGAGCEVVGAACPEGDFAEDLPADAVVWYVRAGAGDGGDGSASTPFGTVAEGIDAAGDGDVVALSKGAFVESIVLPEGVSLRGACSEQTVLSTDAPFGAAGVVTVAGADTALSNVTIAGPGPGLWVEGRDAALDVDGVVIEDADFTGLLVGGGGSLTGRALAVKGVRAQAVPGVSGVGLLVDSRGALELSHVVIERTDGTAVVAIGTDVALEDVVVRDGRGDDPPARGVEAQLGAAVTLRRLWMSGMRDAALLAFDMDTELVVEDAVIAGTTPDAAGEGGRGLSLVDGARATVRRAVFTGQRDVAVLVDGAPSSAELQDVVLAGTRGREVDGTGGSGFAVQWGASATLTRVHVTGSHGVGVLAISDDTTLTLADVTIVGTESLESNGDQGAGLHVQKAAVTGVRLRAAGNRQAGVEAIEDATLALEDLEVAGTRERACADEACAGVGFGDGLISSLGSTVEVTRFRILGSARVGVTIADGELDLHAGEVTGCPIGASVQTEGFDVERLYDHVIFRDNDRNLDRSQLAVPEPVAGF